MARKLKCFMGNYDGRRSGLIFAHSRKEAAGVAGCSLNAFRDFWHDIENWPIQEPKPLTLYTRPIDGRGEFVEGRCDLPVKAQSWGRY